MSYDLQILNEHRDALLLAEVAAWLHMLGKFHEDFLQGQHDLDVQIPPDLSLSHPHLYNLLTDQWPSLFWSGLPISELGAATLSFFDLIKDHRNRTAATGLARLMWDAHGRGSGTEKGVLERFAPGQQSKVYSATAFGYERAIIDLNDLRKNRQVFYTELERWLERLRRTSEANDWGRFHKEFLQQVKAYFRFTVAEGRRPINDVSLFDQTSASAAILKASLAQILLSGWKEPVQTSVADKFKWRFMRVGINGKIFWGQSSRVSDLLARRSVVEKVLDSISTLLETNYPLGAEIYRDENGSIFIVPEDILLTTLQGQPLGAVLEQTARQGFSNEVFLKCEISNATRNMLFLGELTTSELLHPSPKPVWLDAIWKQLTPRDICPVCGVRPQGLGKKAFDRNVCEVCEQRRLDRSKDWVADQLSTIWTDEIADETGRLALIVGTFSLGNWLSGQMLRSVTMFDPETRTVTDPKRNDKVYQFEYQQLIADIQDAHRRKQFTGNNLLDRLVLKPQRGGSFEDFFNIQVIDSDLEQFVISGSGSAELLALAMLCQNPSFARIRRVWETTHTFWLEITKRLKNDESLIQLRGHRLAIIPHNPDVFDLGPFHAYELVVEGIRVSVIWDEPGGRFITADNLDYLARTEQLGRRLDQVIQRGNQYLLEEPAGYGSTNHKLGFITVAQVNETTTVYAPVIPILAEPRTFMALVPANRAMKVMQAIQEKYETEMGKVRNRLPLSLGVVYAGRRTPLSSVLDAGRRMLHYSSQSMRAEVKAISPTNPWPEKVRLKLKVDSRVISLDVPTVMGDGCTPDVWYPYWQVSERCKDRERWFAGPDGEHWVHVCDLRVGDGVAFTPSTFDFEYLDTSARRFEVAYGDDNLRKGQGKKQRPYLLEEIEALEQIWLSIEQKLTTSQIKALETLIESKRQEWDEPTGAAASVSDVFRQFVVDVLQTFGVFSEEMLEASLSGLLADALEIHLTLHKEKP